MRRSRKPLSVQADRRFKSSPLRSTRPKTACCAVDGLATCRLADRMGAHGSAILMAQRWQLDGGKADLDIWPEGAHAFANMATPLRELAAERTTSWIAATLNAA